MVVIFHCDLLDAKTKFLLYSFFSTIDDFASCISFSDSLDSFSATFPMDLSATTPLRLFWWVIKFSKFAGVDQLPISRVTSSISLAFLCRCTKEYDREGVLDQSGISLYRPGQNGYYLIGQLLRLKVWKHRSCSTLIITPIKTTVENYHSVQSHVMWAKIIFLLIARLHVFEQLKKYLSLS